MKTIRQLLYIFLFCYGCLQAQELSFLQNKNSAGKASLTSEAYYANFVLGKANFSPELRMPVQIFYDSSCKDEGLLGFGWKIPQLESSAIPNENGAIWTTPWGEKVFFYSRKHTSRDILSLYNEKERENAYFSPFADWTANGRADSGSWTIYGRKDMRGWKFVYTDAKLRKIEAPSGQSLSFVYNGGKLASVEQLGRAFIELKYGENKVLSEIAINGVSNKVKFEAGSARILPETLAGKEEVVNTQFLSFVGQAGLNPIEFSYDNVGYLTQIKRGKYVDDIEVETETFEQRKAYLARISAAQKAKKPTKNIKKEAADGRILSDSTFKYRYPQNAVGSVELTNKLGETAEYAFDTKRGISTVRDFSGKERSVFYFMRYDVAYNGKVRQIVDGRKRVLASYRYDKDSGKILRARDLAKNDVNFKYDKSGNLVLITKRGADELKPAPVRSFEYNKGNLRPAKINELDEKGEIVRTASINYDKSLRPVYIDNGQRTLKIGYNAYGYPIKTTDAFGRETDYSYDKYNRLVSKTSDGIETSIVYNGNGAQIKSLSKIGGELISSVETVYNADGYPISYKDQDGLEKKFERDGFGRVAKEIFPDNTEVKYAYNELGKLTSVIDQSGHEIKFAWNKYGLDSRTTAIGQITQNTYDDYGRLSFTDSKFGDKPADRTLDYEYDDFDRVSEIRYGANEIEKMKYDSWGRVVEKSKNGRLSRFKYDHFGRMTEKSEDGVLTKYAYDNFGKRISRASISGKNAWVETNAYDKFGRLVKTESAGKVVEYLYNDKNQLAEQIIDGNKIKFAYTKLGRLESKILFGKDGGVLSELRYYYSKSGKIISRLANGKLQGYKYDAKNQLLAVVDLESKTPVEEYVYDASGNILKKTINGKTTAYTYDAANQLASSVASDGKITNYAYDAAGRLIKEGEKTYEYGWLDKVMRVAESGKEVAKFEYHNNGQIAKAIRGGTAETFAWDGLALVERNGIKYINEPHVGGGNPILAIGENSDIIFTDMLGTSLGMVKETGYSAIAKTSFGSDSNDNSSFFTGKPYVEELGYAFLFRNYRADVGKWLSQDLIGYPDGWNNFAYCGNRSTLYIDLFGTASRTICSRYFDSDLPLLHRMQHTWTEVTLTVNEYNSLDSKYKTGDFNGKWDYSPEKNSYTVKMSAYSEDGMLVKKTNDPRDNNPLYYETDYNMDMSNVENILEKHRQYNNTADYAELPFWGEKNNCHSYTNTINDGDVPDFMKDNILYPGINYRIKDKYFTE